MEKIQAYRKWTGKSDGMPEGFHGMSYILFRTDSEGTEILGARCPDSKTFAVGKSFIAAMEAEEDVIRCLASGENHPLPMFVETRTGVGLLLKHYDLQAGMGLYLQIHASPVALSRLLHGGVLGSGGNRDYALGESIPYRGDIRRADEDACPILLDAWTAVQSYRHGHGLIHADPRGTVSCYDLEKAMTGLADFVGCELTVERLRDSGEWARCYRPVLLEALLFCLMTEARSLSSDGRVSCRMGSQGEERRLMMELSYTVEPKRLLSEEYRQVWEIRRHLERVADLGGLELHADVRKPSRVDKAVGALPTVELCLEWLRDPALLPTGDLKADLRLWYGQTRRN